MTRRIVTYGPALPLEVGLRPVGRPPELRRRTVTADAQPQSLEEALAVNSGSKLFERLPFGYSYGLIQDTGANGQWCVVQFPVGQGVDEERRPGPRLTTPPSGEDMPPRYVGITGNPNGGATGPIAMAAPRELTNGDNDWDRATGTKDAAAIAFDAKVHRLRTGTRMRNWNDENRRRYGQRPIGGGPEAA